MKKILTKVFAGLIFPAAALAAVASRDVNIEVYQDQTARIFPYQIEEVLPDGSAGEHFSGTSQSLVSMEIARELGAVPYLEDKFSAFPDIKLGIGSKITLYRAPVFTIYDGKKKIVSRSWQRTVEEVLTEANILELGVDDKINFSLTTEAESGMEIRITRIAITQVKEKKTVDFQIIKKDDKTLDQGKTRIDQAGQKGELTLTYEVRREDGVQISKKLLTTETTKKSVDQILIVGTKPVITGWCKYNDWVLDASIKNNLDPNKICALMRKESNGNPNSSGQGGAHIGLFQYDPGFWEDISKKAGYAGASITDAKAQIYTTAWAFTHGYAGRW